MHFPPVSSTTLLPMIALKAMNDTIGEYGLDPDRVVSRTIPRFLFIGTELPKQKERMEIIAKA